jgi:hypothetical protein
VTLYTIDPRGLTALGDEAIAVSGFAQRMSAPGTGDCRIRWPEHRRRVHPRRADRSQDDLRTLAEEPAASPRQPTNFDTAFDRIVRDSGSYVLAYYRRRKNATEIPQD